MIKIQVQGKDLVLYKNMSIEVELNSAMFATDAIEGDVAYSFDIPIAGNEITMEFGHNPHTKPGKHWPCMLLYNGIPFISGNLYLQKIAKDKMTVGIVLNPYPDGFSDQSIRDNTSETVTISQSSATHREKWLTFLQNSITNPAFKFAPFLNETGYGSNNDDFGQWNGILRGKMVNRLFFNAHNVPFSISDKPFFRIFCEANNVGDEDNPGTEYNQFCFCPQIQLIYILKNIVSEAGYSLCGNILGKPDFQKLYIQSGNALDGPSTQYDTYPHYYLHVSTTYQNITSTQWKVLSPIDRDTQNMLSADGKITFYTSGFYEIHFSARVHLLYDCELFFRIGNGTDFCIDKSMGTYSENEDTEDKYSIYFNQIVYIPANYTNTGLFVGLMFEAANLDNAVESNQNAALSVTSKTTEDGWLNIFAKEFTPAKFFPDVTNAEFIKAVTQSLGVAFFVDYNTKQIELSAAADVLNARSLDLTEYLIQDKSEQEVPDEKKYCFKFVSVEKDTDIDETLLLEDVVSEEDLPDPYVNIGKIVFVQDHNAFYMAEKVEDETYNYRLEWKKYAENNRLMTVGTGDDTETTNSEVKIPAIANLAEDYDSRKQKLYCSIPFEIKSYLNPDSEELKDIIMLYYRGKDHYFYRNRINQSQTIYYEDMLPVKAGELSLTASGERSWGARHLQKWFELYSRHRTITYTFLLPITKLLEVIQLVRPQNADPSMQTRSVMVNNVKSWPVKITFQMENTGDLVTTKIESAFL